jgi:hypothetical protein
MHKPTQKSSLGNHVKDWITNVAPKSERGATITVKFPTAWQAQAASRDLQAFLNRIGKIDVVQLLRANYPDGSGLLVITYNPTPDQMAETTAALVEIGQQTAADDLASVIMGEPVRVMKTSQMVN